MLFKRETLDLIADGRVTLAFRRWTRPRVKAGATLATAVGVLVVDAVQKVAPSAVKEADIASAGYVSRRALLEALPGDGDLYRIAFHRAAAGPANGRARNGRFTKKEMRSVIVALKRLDQASPRGPWTRTFLRLIDKYPARRAPDLAASLGREPMIFQHDVTKLRELGLTENLEIGYRLSQRGRIVLSEISEP